MKFRFLGTEIYVSFLFSAVITFVLVTDRSGLAVPTLFAAFIHESGHLLAMWASGSQPKAIRLIPASVQIIRDMPIKKGADALISICGPAANLVVFLSLLGNYLIFKNEISFRFAVLNMIIAIFNLLPIYGLDGGDLLIIALSKNGDFYKAQRTVRIITGTFALAAFCVGVWLCFMGTFNPSVFIIVVYLVICCTLKY